MPNFKIRLSSCLDEQSIDAIERNMEDVFSESNLASFFGTKGLNVAHLLVDGVAVDPRLDVDLSQLPHQFTGLCLHCKNTKFITFEDGERIETELDREGVNMQKIHFAKEVEVWCIGLNSKDVTFLVPVALIPTCKKDYELGESTSTIATVGKVVINKYYEMGLDKKIGPLSWALSDGASHFRQGTGQVLSKDLPTDTRNVYKDCLLCNKIGGERGTSNNCDGPHLGKRSRARIKSAKGLKIGCFTFVKTELARYTGLAGIVTDSGEANRLLDPEENTDVAEMAKCLDKVGKLTELDILCFPPDWHNDQSKKTLVREMRLLGNVRLVMCALIIGHDGGALEDGDHLSVSEYLVRCSRLSHLLFFLFCKNKTKVLAAQNFRNWQDTIKNMFLSVTLGKLRGVDHFYFFHNTNNRLEQLFGILRSMINGNMNFDCLDLQDRIADATLVQWIYTQHPEWDRSARKLTNTVNRKNT